MAFTIWLGAWLALSFVGVALLAHLATALVAALRARRGVRGSGVGAPPPLSGVSIVRPVRGLEAIERETLASSFAVAAPNVELLFCVATADDPVVPFLRRLIAEHPGVDARILVGRDLGTANPKLDNVVKGWRAARHEWVVLSDSNVLIPPDYTTRLAAAWRPDTGLVCAPPIGAGPTNFWAEVECAFLDTYQARWQYAADSLGYGFAQGKSMLWRKADLDRWGGIEALAAELAEDAAATKLVRKAGKRVRLADPSFLQLLGRRRAGEVVARQIRWAQLRRATFPAQFAPEILTGSALPVAAAMFAACAFELSPTLAGGGVLAIWFATDAALAHAAGWHLTWRSPFAWFVRDLLIPAVWVRAIASRGYEWHGKRVVVARRRSSNPSAA
jgi:ceramide glucosyltransferase